MQSSVGQLSDHYDCVPLSETYAEACVLDEVLLPLSLSLSTQMHHNGDAQISSGPGGRDINTPSSMRFSWSVMMGCDRAAAPLNLPSFPRDSSSFWIWFSRKNMATANASSARSCNLGGIMTLSSPIKSSREGFGQSMLSGGDTANTHTHTHTHTQRRR